MANIQLVAGASVVIAGVTYVAQPDGRGGMTLTDAPSRKALNFDKATGNLKSDDGTVVGRVNFRNKMASDAIPELGASNVSIVVSDTYAKGYDLTIAKVANTNVKEQPKYAGGATIGTRQEWALFLTRQD